MRYLAILHQDRPDGLVGVMVPDLPGCFSAGDTLAEKQPGDRPAPPLVVGSHQPAGRDHHRLPICCRGEPGLGHCGVTSVKRG